MRRHPTNNENRPQNHVFCRRFLFFPSPCQPHGLYCPAAQGVRVTRHTARHPASKHTNERDGYACFQADRRHVPARESRGQKVGNANRLRLLDREASRRSGRGRHPHRRFLRERHLRVRRYSLSYHGRYDPPQPRGRARSLACTHRMRHALPLLRSERGRRGAQRRPPFEGRPRERREARGRTRSLPAGTRHRGRRHPRDGASGPDAAVGERLRRLQGAGQDRGIRPSAPRQRLCA